VCVCVCVCMCVSVCVCVCVCVNFIHAGAALLSQDDFGLNGKMPGSKEPGSGTPALIYYYVPNCLEIYVISMERSPGFQGWGGDAVEASPSAPGRSSRAAAGSGRKKSSRSLLCDAHFWAPRDMWLACALRMCGTFVYYGIT
jgi:hypothetical protein